MGDLAATDVYGAFDVPLDQGTNVGWANRLGEILTARPQYDETVQYKTASPLVNISEGDIGRATEAAMGVSGGGMTVQGPKGIRAYHGSPHDFERVDLSKIGTGEGAQAYGHGLYFAEGEPVARAYRDALAPHAPTFEGKPIETRQDFFGVRDPLESVDWRQAKALEHFQNLSGPVENRLKELRNWYRDDKGMAAAIDALEPKVGTKSKGHMYEVNINADPAHFLDWDKPLVAQPEAEKQLKKFYQGAFGLDQNDFRNALRTKAFAEQTAAEGIPGIKYLDQGSRASLQVEPKLLAARTDADDLARALETYRASKAQLGARGQASVEADIERTARALESKQHEITNFERQLREGTSNYVVFDDKLIDILKKYGLAGLPAGAAGMGALAAQDRYSE